MNKKPSVIDFLKELYNIWVVERPVVLAAALAYYSMFSFAPVIYIAFTVAGFFIDSLLLDSHVIDRLERVLSPELIEYIQNMVDQVGEKATGSNWLLSLIGIIALLYAASGLFFQLQNALNTIWNAPPPQNGGTSNFIRQRLFSFLMVLGVGLLLIVVTLVSLIISILRSILPVSGNLQLGSLIAFIGIVTLSFALLYKILPDIKVAWRDVWLGAGLAAFLVTIGGFLLGWYVSNSGVSSALAAAGTFAVILVAFYYMAQIFLFGALFGRVYTYMYGSKSDNELSSMQN